MSITVPHVGTFATATFTTASVLQWTPAVAPTPGNAVIVVWAFENPASTSVPTPTIADASANTWLSTVISPNTSGISGLGGISAAIFLCPVVGASSVGQITVTCGTGGGRSTFVGNHIEVAGLIASPTDQSGIYSSGATHVTAATVAASAPNASANDLVVTVISVHRSSGFVGPGDPPSAGYTSIMTDIISSGSGIATCDAGYKVVTGIETSQAAWSGWSSTGVAAAAIATFSGATGATGNFPVRRNRRVISKSHYPQYR